MQSGFVGTGYVSERKVSTFREETPRAAKRRPGSISLPMDTVAWFALESIDLLDLERNEEKCQTTWRKLFLNRTFDSLGSG